MCLRTSRHPSVPNGDFGKESKSPEVTPSPVMSRGEPSEVLEVIEAAFDAVAMSVGFRVVGMSAGLHDGSSHM